MKELYCFENCSANALCSSLPLEMRETLCSHCAKSCLSAGSIITYPNDSLVLPLSGICASTYNKKVEMVYPCGFLAAFPTSETDSWHYSNMRIDSAGNEYPPPERVKLISVTDSACAIFKESHIQELWADPDFAKAIRKNWYWGASSMFAYNITVFRQDAYHAVRYILQYAKSQNVTYLTHAQIAYLADLGRSTVTQAMNELIAAEPELFNE